MGPRVITLTNGAFAENCYLVADPDTGDAAIVDPGEEVGLFRARLAHEHWTLRAIWLTHAHVDHVAGVAGFRDTPVPIYLHPADRVLYDRSPAQAAMFGLTMEAPPPPDHELADGGSVAVGAYAFGVVHTPGHTPGGDLEALLASVHDRLFALPDETVVYSGHGPATTIGAEKKDNPFVKLVPGINACLKCGAPVKGKPWGCKNPCPNCGHVYPLGDCSD